MKSERLEWLQNASWKSFGDRGSRRSVFEPAKKKALYYPYKSQHLCGGDSRMCALSGVIRKFQKGYMASPQNLVTDPCPAHNFLASSYCLIILSTPTTSVLPVLYSQWVTVPSFLIFYIILKFITGLFPHWAVASHSPSVNELVGHGLWDTLPGTLWFGTFAPKGGMSYGPTLSLFWS